VIRTRSALRGALLDLVRERDLTDVTMNDVAERALVNRATIYLHYRDRDTLVVDAMEDAVGGIVADVARCVAERRPAEAVPGQLLRLFTHVEVNRRLYGRLLGPEGSARFTARLRELFTDAWRMELPGASAIAGEFLAGALIGVIAGWATEQRPRPAEQIAGEFWRLAADVHRSQRLSSF
jgi:AcrR family transcriptional regulator